MMVLICISLLNELGTLLYTFFGDSSGLFPFVLGCVFLIDL